MNHLTRDRRGLLQVLPLALALSALAAAGSEMPLAELQRDTDGGGLADRQRNNL